MTTMMVIEMPPWWQVGQAIVLRKGMEENEKKRTTNPSLVRMKTKGGRGGNGKGDVETRDGGREIGEML